MRLQEFFFIVISLLCAPFVAAQEIPQAQDFRATVLAITELKFRFIDFRTAYGTGFCLDAPCRFVVSNYHVAQLTRPAKIAGHKIVARYFATGPNDEDATQIRIAGAPSMRFKYSRDLAIFELESPLTSRHGANFSLEELQLGQRLAIYVYPVESRFEPRKLIQFQGHFTGITAQGLLAVDYEPVGRHRIRPGSSGGVVVDEKSQRIVGVVSAITDDDALTAFAVPAPSLAEFLSKVEPDLAQKLFAPSVSTVTTTFVDFYPKLEPSLMPNLQHRSEESPAIKLLRNKAQILADGMQNFIARQSVEWGSGNKPTAASATYEIRVLDGDLKFREYPNGKKELRDLPFPPLNTAIVTGGEWSELPRLIALQPRLRIEQMPDSFIGGRPIRVFRYRGDAEDCVCRWRSSLDFGFFGIKKDAIVPCYGEVWTDEDTNILRMSEHYELPGAWKGYEAVMTYGWLRRPGDEPRLLPTAIASQAQYHGKTYWCRSQFRDYQVFMSEVRMTMK